MALLFLLCSFLAVEGQRRFPDRRGCLIYTLGPDTTAIGNYELRGYDFSMTVADLTEAVTVSKLKGTFFPNGEIRSLEGTMYQPVAGGDAKVLSTYRLSYVGDSTVIEVQR